MKGKDLLTGQGFDGAFDGTGEGDELVGNLAPGLPRFRPMIPRLRTHGTDYDTIPPGMRASCSLGVVPDRDYRVEVRVPETTER